MANSPKSLVPEGDVRDHPMYRSFTLRNRVEWEHFEKEGTCDHAETIFTGFFSMIGYYCCAPCKSMISPKDYHVILRERGEWL